MVNSLLSQLRRDEGVRYVPYQDSRGYWTQGCGHRLLASELGPDGLPLSTAPVTDEQVDAWLAADVAQQCAPLVNYPWFVGLDEVRQAVFQGMSYNMGLHGLLGFPSMIHYASVQDWPNAAAQMRSSLWAQQVGARAVRLEQQLETGQWV